MAVNSFSDDAELQKCAIRSWIILQQQKELKKKGEEVNFTDIYLLFSVHKELMGDRGNNRAIDS